MEIKRDFWGSFWRGMASFNLAGQLSPLDLPSEEDAIRADWEAVGNDLRNAMAAIPVSPMHGEGP